MTQPLPSSDDPVGPDAARRPTVLIFDVNETLSDMSPLAQRFEDVGAPGHLAALWFAGLLRDGFALTVAGVGKPFADIGAEVLRAALHDKRLTSSLDAAVDHIMGGFSQLDVHADVPEGIRALRRVGLRLVTLSNGSSAIAEGLLQRAGLQDHVERFLSVDAAGIWKPAPGSYAYALRECRVAPVDAMLVAVHPWDTDGAARAGLASAWVNRGGATYPAYFRSPDLSVASLVELAERLA